MICICTSLYWSITSALSTCKYAQVLVLYAVCAYMYHPPSLATFHPIVIECNKPSGMYSTNTCAYLHVHTIAHATLTHTL